MTWKRRTPAANRRRRRRRERLEKDRQTDVFDRFMYVFYEAIQASIRRIVPVQCDRCGALVTDPAEWDRHIFHPGGMPACVRAKLN